MDNQSFFGVFSQDHRTVFISPWDCKCQFRAVGEREILASCVKRLYFLILLRSLNYFFSFNCNDVSGLCASACGRMGCYMVFKWICHTIRTLCKPPGYSHLGPLPIGSPFYNQRSGNMHYVTDPGKGRIKGFLGCICPNLYAIYQVQSGSEGFHPPLGFITSTLVWWVVLCYHPSGKILRRNTD